MIAFLVSACAWQAQPPNIAMLSHALGMDAAAKMLDNILYRRLQRRSNRLGQRLTLSPDGRRVYYSDSRSVTGVEYPLSAPGVDLPTSKIVFDEEISILYLSGRPPKIRVGNQISTPS